MKLVRVEHYRCGEHDKYEYFVAKDDVTAEQLQKDVEVAQKNYLAALAAREDLGERPQRLSLENAFPSDQTTTLSEARRKVAERQAEIDEWDRKSRSFDRPFDHWMTEQLGYQTLGQACALTADVSWGHRHGKTLHYGHLWT
jgi:hypothetical protein